MSAKYEVTFTTTINLTVRLDAPNEDAAADEAWNIAHAYLGTVYGNSQGVVAEASLDGIGADEVTEIGPADD